MTESERLMHVVLVAISLLDEGEPLMDSYVFAACMPSLAPLFKDGEKQIALDVAVKRCLEHVEARL